MRTVTKLTLTLLIFSLLTIPVFASQTFKASSFRSPFSSKSCVKNNNGLLLNLEYQTARFEELDNGVSVVNFEDVPILQTQGLPSIPVTGSFFRLPPASGVDVEIIQSDYELIQDIDYASVINELDDIYGMPENIEDSWYPLNLAEVSEPMIFGDFRIAKLMTYPVQVNTARREVRIYNNIEVQINFGGTDNRNTLPEPPSSISAAKLPLYRMLLDWNEAELDEFVLYRGNMQVIMRDNVTLENSFSEWFEWKRQKGWTIDLLTDSDVPSFTSAAIRNELINRWENNKFDYIVIIGDDWGTYAVQASSGQGYGNGDYLYACVAGTDHLPDVGIGRISIQNPQQAVEYSQKVINYEKNVRNENPEWIQRSFMALFSPNSDIYPVMTNRYLSNLMYDCGFTNVDTSYVEPYGTSHGNNGVRAEASEALTNGISYFTSCGYLGAGFNYLQLVNISPDNPLARPVCVDLTEGTGNWSNGDGLNEGYMRGVGIGGIGTATSGVKIRYTELFRTACGYSLYGLKQPHMGDMVFTADVLAFKNFQGIEDANLFSHVRWLNLMGDPTVWLWSDIPKELDVSIDGNVEFYRNSYSVTVTSENRPVKDAWVTLYKADTDEYLIQTANSNSSGVANLEFPVQYEGEYYLTVSKPNYAVSVDTGFVSATDTRLAIYDLAILDDGSAGTVGNGNGIPDAGETVGIHYTLSNMTDSEETNINLELFSDDPWINIITNQLELTSLAANEHYSSIDPFLVEISDEAQDNWQIFIDIFIASDQAYYEDKYPVILRAPSFSYNSLTTSADIQPGGNGDLTIEIYNNGGDAFTGGTARLDFHHEFLSFNQQNIDVPQILPGDEAEIVFEVSVLNTAWNGFTTYGQIVFLSSTDQVDTLTVPVTVGTVSMTDPSGPDYYGYSAFEHRDIEFAEYIPENYFVEISTFAEHPEYNGIQIDLTDYASDLDDSVVLDLPFDITYYGETFDQITVCSNGWVAMGSQEDMISAYDYVIPGPCGPNYMIAPYYDELVMMQNEAGAFYYYDETNGRFIIEWHNARDINYNELNTFEIIFYDLEVMNTPTGDNVFDFVYLELNPVAGGWWTRSPSYFVAGIENGNQQDGLMLIHANSPSPGIHDSFNNSAIRFTTQASTMSGSLEGVITDGETNEAIEGATVTVSNSFNTISAQTDASGLYSIEFIRSGVNQFRVSSACYTSIDGEIEIETGTTSDLSLDMLAPEIEISAIDIFHTAGLGEIVHDQTQILNEGEGDLFVSSFILPPEGGNLNTFIEKSENSLTPTLLTKFALQDIEELHNGVIFDGEYFWIAGGCSQSVNLPNKLYKYSMYGELLESYNQPVPDDDASEEGFKDLAWDGQFIYGYDAGFLYKMSATETGVEMVERFDVPGYNCDYLAFNPADSLFYYGEDDGVSVRVLDYDGNLVDEFDNEFTITGACNVPVGNSQDIYIITNNQRSHHSDIYSIESGNFDSHREFLFEKEVNSWQPRGLSTTDLWDKNRTVLITVQDYGETDSLAIWEYSVSFDWLTIDIPEGIVPPGEALDIDIEMQGFGDESILYEMGIEILHNACAENRQLIHIVLDYDVDVEDSRNETPSTWALHAIYPNPFNSRTNISFDLADKGYVDLKIFNLLGQQVADLSVPNLQAGSHVISFDGNLLSSGIYFVNFKAGPIQEVRKIMLLK